jgi:DNA-nicking Smr family endonuclease
MSDGGRRRGLTAEERVLWAHVTKAIAPLRTPAPADDDADAGDEAPLARLARIKPPPQTSAAPPPRVSAPLPPPLAPLGRRMKQRVARGKQEIDGRLDLHGLTQSEAHPALLRFLRAASARQARLVLVITGKGARGEGGGERGVLRRQLPHWLALPEFRALVIGYEPAAIAHGGEGAWYISVRRTRD